MRIAIGIETGGTSTYAVAYDYEQNAVLVKSKALTTKEDLSVGISKVLDMIPPEYIRDAVMVSLSTTLATNACVEDKGGRAKLVIFGLTDELMERLKVEEQYGIKHGFVKCFDTHSSADGQHIDEPDWDELMKDFAPWLSDADCMAAAELYGPSTGAPCEKKFKALIKENYGLDTICAMDLTDKIDVIQRGATAVLNAKLLPVVSEFIDICINDIRKRGCKAPVMIIRSDGSLMSTDASRMKPVETIVSGPAASVLAGKKMSGKDSYFVVDMGGTTTDCSIVTGGMTRNFAQGIKIGNWKTSVEGVFVDTFALGGDSTMRFEQGALKLLARRSIPLCTAAVRFPEVLNQLKELRDTGDISKFPLYEFLYLLSEPKSRDRYSEEELKIIDILKKEGPCSLYKLRKMDIDLYIMKTDRLEEEGVIIRFGLTPTDFMHIKGDYTEYSAEASRLAVDYIYTDNRIIPTDELAIQLADEAYNLVEEKLYTNLVRIMLQQDHQKELAEGIGDELDYLIKDSWKNYRENRNGLCRQSFCTDLPILGMGAPIHVFLPKVAEALGSCCIVDDNAEIATALGSLLAEIIVRSKVEITQWEDAGMLYMVHDEKGSTKYRDLKLAEAHAIESAKNQAEKEARLRGAVGPLEFEIIKEGNSHDRLMGNRLVYGGTVSCIVRLAIGQIEG